MAHLHSLLVCDAFTVSAEVGHGLVKAKQANQSVHSSWHVFTSMTNIAYAAKKALLLMLAIALFVGGNFGS